VDGVARRAGEVGMRALRTNGQFLNLLAADQAAVDD